MRSTHRLKLSVLCIVLTSSVVYGTDLDVFAGSGNISGRSAYWREDNTGVGGEANKAWTPFTPYESNLSLGVRLLQSYIENFPTGQLGAELSYFTASAQLPADRIVERWASGNLVSQNTQAMTDGDRVRIDTGRATFSVGFSLPLFPERIYSEFGLLGGFGFGRVRDAVTLQTNGQVFNSYASMSIHWGISLRLRALLTQFLSVGVEYRYSEEVGKNFGKSTDRSIVSYRVDSNQFIGWIGYRFGRN